MKEEFQNEKFLSAIGAGLTLVEAYNALHFETIAKCLMELALKESAEKSLRPTENAVNTPLRNSLQITGLNKKQREEIEKRVLNGEKINL